MAGSSASANRIMARHSTAPLRLVAVPGASRSNASKERAIESGWRPSRTTTRVPSTTRQIGSNRLPIRSSRHCHLCLPLLTIRFRGRDQLGDVAAQPLRLRGGCNGNRRTRPPSAYVHRRPYAPPDRSRRCDLHRPLVDDDLPSALFRNLLRELEVLPSITIDERRDPEATKPAETRRCCSPRCARECRRRNRRPR